ncbi:MAG: sulfatase-like hydrolase/transferase [Planctomycetaceae bacterium]|nr:sulfatase-like hydrolase/transferase [Planctomycetaceae bacterium]
MNPHPSRTTPIIVPRNFLSLLFAAVLTVLSIHRTDAADRPNVVFILSDDQAWKDYGFMGHQHIQTPNLDALAREGLLYERGYVTAPLCRPSLASLVTGLYPHQTGIRGNDPVMPAGAKRPNSLPLFAKLRQRMTEPLHHQPSFIRALKDNGYATLQTGKWWEGDPKDHGFTHAMTHGDELRGGRHGDEGLNIGRKTMQPIYDFVDAAVEKDQPFFVWYGVFLPHAPHNAPERFYNKYKDVAPNEPTAWYWANVDWFDETCGQLVDYLKSKGLYEKTVFVYTCDNGWVPDPKRRNKYVRSKQEPVEAGIRTPIFLTHAGTIRPHRDATTLASNVDIPSTILKICNIAPDKAMQGLDLRDTAALQDRNRVFVESYQHDSDLDQLSDINNGLKARVLIQGWDKLIARPDGVELFDLKSDPDDRVNLAGTHPQKANALIAQLNKWLSETSVPGPSK